MVKQKFDIKNIFIVILGILLILNIIFRPKYKIDMHENEIKNLHQSNDSLIKDNEKLKLHNIKLDSEIKGLLIDIYKTKNELGDNKNKINNLEHDKNKIDNYVNNLNADGIAKSFSDYLNRTESKNNRKL